MIGEEEESSRHTLTLLIWFSMKWQIHVYTKDSCSKQSNKCTHNSTFIFWTSFWHHSLWHQWNDHGKCHFFHVRLFTPSDDNMLSKKTMSCGRVNYLSPSHYNRVIKRMARVSGYKHFINDSVIHILDLNPSSILRRLTIAHLWIGEYHAMRILPFLNEYNLTCIFKTQKCPMLSWRLEAWLEFPHVF